MDNFVTFEYDRHLRVWCVTLMGVTVYVKPKDFKPLKNGLVKLNKSYYNMVGVLKSNGIIG